MDAPSLAAAIYSMNMLANDVEPIPVVKGCLFEYGCPYHIDKMVQSLIDDVNTNKKNMEKDLASFFPTPHLTTNQNIYKNLDYLAERRNQVDYSKLNREKTEETVNVDVNKVWDIQVPILFSYGNNTERRSSCGTLNISFTDEDEFTHSSEMKKIIEAMVES